MDNTLSKQLLLSILGLAILIVAIVGVSYAVLVEPNSNLNSKDIVYIDYDTDVDGISLIGSLPMKDSEGIGMSSYLDFKVISNVSSNNNINYEVLLERVKDDNFASSKAVYSLAEYCIVDKNSKKMFSILYVFMCIYVYLYLVLSSVNQT